MEVSNSSKSAENLLRELKRSNYISWDDYFMAVALLTAMRSKDPCSQVGACIVNKENVIVAVGYNGMPTGIHDDLLTWRKEGKDPLDKKYMYVCHAEMNAIMNKNSINLTDCTMYVALHPCNECAKLIIQAGIKEVLYLSNKHSDKLETIASTKMLVSAGVSCRPFKVNKNSKITLDFSSGKHMSGEAPYAVIEESSSFYNRTGAAEQKRDVNKKRDDYLAWDEYFMALATLSSLRSKEPCSQTGACIVNNANKIVGIGYNGLPRECSDETLHLDRIGSENLKVRHMYVCHAEMNAIMNKNCADVQGCIMYVAQFPCNECVKILIQAGIKKVVYLHIDDENSPEIRASQKLLKLAGIEYVPYTSKKGMVEEMEDIKLSETAEKKLVKKTKVIIDFEAIDWNSKSS